MPPGIVWVPPPPDPNLRETQLKPSTTDLIRSATQTLIDHVDAVSYTHLTLPTKA